MNDVGFFDRLFGSAGTCGKNLRWELDGDTLTISGTGDMELYGFVGEIPWYDKRTSIRRIVIEDGVKTISYYAFVGCENVTSVTIGNSVTTIDSHAFTDCKRLTNVTIGNSVTTIDGWAFERCENLTSITIPDSVTTIDSYIFSDCKNLKEIHYPAGRGFEEHLSEGNNAKLIPYTVTPPAATKPATQTATRPKPTTQTVTRPKPTNQQKFYPVQSTTKPVAEKLTWKFSGKTLTVGGVREIKCFPYEKIPWVDHLRQVQKLVIGNGVEKIAAHAFDECTRLELLELPASVTNIGDFAFNCSFCGNIKVNGGKNVFWCLEDGVLVLKKNPDVKSNADFSTGAVQWIFAEKNITGVKLEPGIVPTEKFFAWLAKRTNGAQISFG